LAFGVVKVQLRNKKTFYINEIFRYSLSIKKKFRKSIFFSLIYDKIKNMFGAGFKKN
jgi:hypothetical protein